MRQPPAPSLAAACLAVLSLPAVAAAFRFSTAPPGAAQEGELLLATLGALLGIVWLRLRR